MRNVRSPGAIQEIEDLREEVEKLKHHNRELEETIMSNQENSSQRKYAPRSFYSEEGSI